VVVNEHIDRLGRMAASDASAAMATSGFQGHVENPPAGTHAMMDTPLTVLRWIDCIEVREDGADESTIMRPPMATINLGDMDTPQVLQSHVSLTTIHVLNMNLFPPASSSPSYDRIMLSPV
jgi:hypothetical protein